MRTPNMMHLKQQDNDDIEVVDIIERVRQASRKLPEQNLSFLLENAYKVIARSEKVIDSQEKRIRNLQNLLTKDELTGLTNRRGFMENFAREIDRTNRDQSQGGLLLMIDLDDFKIINDTFGHMAGDIALKAVADFLYNEVRDMDTAARLGGDEFLILMPDTSSKQAELRTNILKNRMNELSFFWQGKTIGIKGSLGMKDYKKGDTLEDILKDVDSALYKNKDKKRSTKPL
ncbi:MAG: GGDEF domain-containing protein [Alphaproteobacteria bacterium]|nr:GGDEF domain-containing protein [Alphaproteobacteria bacterium]